MKLSRLLLPLALLGCIGSVSAQQAQPSRPAPAQGQQAAAAKPAQPALTPEQQAQLAKQNAQMTQAAQQVIQMVDGNRIGEIWDSASATMKRAVTRDEFVKQVTIDRNKLGKPAGRGQAVVTRSQFRAGDRVPEGLYLNIAVPTKFANAQQPVRELVSFRLDEDKTWRVSGYSLR
ncbi:DUF4019 domain-containing protein [Luteimonas panaciterrae]|uniref:DUF4019 domain-containing protein n=1 Tax=Luteimonas panaciterrae TaxID=363885 RepID=UPI001CFAA83D|nr:DUF4019 domain-containing protein [Luteimonas panaciterrae]